ncbi:MAG: hypothetical protein ACLQNE_10805 [Thermoguttaceae bacterium]
MSAARRDPRIRKIRDSPGQDSSGGDFFEVNTSDPSPIGPMDGESLGRLLDEHGAALRLYARQFCDCPEDVIQEVMKSLAPDAKADLFAAGYAKDVVEAMSPAQAVFSDMFEVYEVRRDDLLKWFYVPYWRAAEEMERLESGIKTASTHAEFALLAESLGVDLRNVIYTEARIERQLAVVRVIEAIRLYAAAHGGKLPAKLEEIREVPLPINPVTGKPFAYHLDGDTAILDAEGGKVQQQFRVKLMK